MKEMQNCGKSSKEFLTETSKSITTFQPRLIISKVFLFSGMHILALIGLYQFMFVAQWKTLMFAWLMYVLSGLGVTAGAHRLWTHRTYKATTSLRVFLMLCDTLAVQSDVIEWSRDHRAHHKWSDTDADPHNSNRGFFFSHMGWFVWFGLYAVLSIWLLYTKHPEVLVQTKTINTDDLTADPVLRFQHKYFLSLAIVLSFILPSVIPWCYWGESIWVAYCTTGVLRYCFTLHCTCMVNSVAHLWGNRPYDKRIIPRQSALTSFMALGEGWHNYHHAFPYDYKTAELPYTMNFTTAFIDGCALLGLAYDRKTVTVEAIRNMKQKHGDDSIPED